MHLLVFFSPLVESLILFFTQLICRVVKIIPFVFHFSDLLSRSFPSRSLIQKSKKFKDKPCGNNAAYGAAYFTPKNFVGGHFIKFVGNHIYLPRLATETLRANVNMHQTNSGKSPKFVFSPTFIFCSPICPNN